MEDLNWVNSKFVGELYTSVLFSLAQLWPTYFFKKI
jgi:hypothetical protein